MSSKFFIRNSSSWTSPGNIYIGSGSGNQSVQNVYYRKAGAWEEVWPGLLNIDASGILITIEHNDTFVDHGGSIGLKPSYYFNWALHTRFPNPFDHNDTRRNGKFPEIFYPQRICDYINRTLFLAREDTASSATGSSGGRTQITNRVRYDEAVMNTSEFALATTLNDYQIYINLANLETVYPSTHPVWDLPGALGDEFRFALMAAWHPDTPGTVNKSVDFEVEWFQGGTLTYNTTTERYYIASPTNSETESFTVTPSDADQSKYTWEPDTNANNFWEPAVHELDYNFCVTQISYNWQNSTAGLVPTGSKSYTEPYDLSMPRYIYVEVEGDTIVDGFISGVSYIDSPDIDTSGYTPVSKYDLVSGSNFTAWGNVFVDYRMDYGNLSNIATAQIMSNEAEFSGNITAGQDSPVEFVNTNNNGANSRMDGSSTSTDLHDSRRFGITNTGSPYPYVFYRSGAIASIQGLSHRFWLMNGTWVNSNSKGSCWYVFNVYQFKWDNPDQTEVTLKFNAYMNEVSLDQGTVTNVYKIDPPGDYIDTEKEEPPRGLGTGYYEDPVNNIVDLVTSGNIYQVGTANITGNVTSVTSDPYEPQTGDNQVTVTINYETGTITVS